MIEDVLTTDFDGCTFDLTIAGSQATLISCNGAVYRGTITPAGIVEASISDSEIANGCGFTIRVVLHVNARMNPTTATFTGSFDFGTECVFTDTGQQVRDCNGTARARWQRY